MEKINHAENAMKATNNKWIDVVRDATENQATIGFVLQSAPASEVGVNGCQAVDMLEYVQNLFVSLNESFPCAENVQTIISIDAAIDFQKQRTADREKRGVEGKHEA